jgi:hypothetical protein
MLWYVSSLIIHQEENDNLGEKGGGRDTMELPQFEMAVRVEKIKLYPVNSYLYTLMGVF